MTLSQIFHDSQRIHPRHRYPHARNKPKNGPAQIVITPLLQKHDQKIQGYEKDHLHDYHFCKTRASNYSDKSLFRQSIVQGDIGRCQIPDEIKHEPEYKQGFVIVIHIQAISVLFQIKSWF